MLDLLIIGAGPTGLSAADAAAKEGLDYIVVEKGTIANTIRQYPVGRTLFSTPNELEMREGTLKPLREKPTREELLSHYIHFVLDRDLKINTGERVVDVSGDIEQGFFTTTDRAEYHAARVLFAIGAMDIPRRLNVPGEDLPKVHHLFVEPYAYIRKDAQTWHLLHAWAPVRHGNRPARRHRRLLRHGQRAIDDWIHLTAVLNQFCSHPERSLSTK